MHFPKKLQNMIQPASAAEIGTRWSRSARKGRKVAKIAKKIFWIYRTTYEISNLNFQPLLGAWPYRKVHRTVFSLYLCNFPIPSLRTAEIYRKKTCWLVAVTYTCSVLQSCEFLDDDKQGF